MSSAITAVMAPALASVASMARLCDCPAVLSDMSSDVSRREAGVAIKDRAAEMGAYGVTFGRSSQLVRIAKERDCVRRPMK